MQISRSELNTAGASLAQLLSMSTPLEKHRSRLTCCKCKKLYKDPKTLGCLHTFCSECLNADGTCPHPLAKTKLTEQWFTCGETPSEIPERIDQAMKNLVELLQQEDSAASGEAKCTFCTEGNNAVAFCRNCKRELQLLCQSCKDSHGKQRLTADHKVVLRSELRSSQANVVGVQQRPWVCPHHERVKENKVVSFYCFTCKETICMTCAVTKLHKLHEVESATEVIDEVRAKLKEKVEAFTPIREKFSTTVEEIKGTVERLTKCKEDKDKKIEERFQATIQEITKQRDTLLTRNQAIFEKKKCILQDQLEAFYGVDAKVNDTLTATGNTLEGIDVEVLQSKERLETRLDQLYNNYKDYPCDLKDNDIIIFEPNEDFNFSDSIGTVYSDLHPEESTLEGFENVQFIKGKKVELSLTCRDILGTQLLNSDVGEQHIQAAMYPAGQEAQIYNGEVKMMGEGRFKIFFTPRAIGSHMLKVTINQRLVKNSRFQVLVSPQILKLYQRTKRMCFPGSF